MKHLLSLCLLILSMSAQAAGSLPFFRDFDSLAADDTRALLMLFSQPDCAYCDLVRNEFLLPLHQQPPQGLQIRELKVPGTQPVNDADGQALSARELAHRYGINFFPSVLLIAPDGRALGAPLVGISSRDFYGHYLDQAITAALQQQP